MTQRRQFNDIAIAATYIEPYRSTTVGGLVEALGYLACVMPSLVDAAVLAGLVNEIYGVDE